MAESPTPETGTPESQSPARTPPALITTEELLQSMALKSPGAGLSSAEVSPGGSVSRNGPAARYASLRAADESHKLQALLLPSEEELRAAALGARPTVGPPPRLPHQLSPALTSILLGWRALYESCGTRGGLQRLVGESYAPGAVFEDALVSARGQEAIYRQFAMLGAAARAVQVGAYSLSVVPLSSPVVEAPTSALLKAAKAAAERSQQQQQPPEAASPTQQPRRGAPQRMGLRQRAAGPSSGPSQGLAAQPAGAAAGGAPETVALHLTRVAVENVQSFTLAAPQWLTWLLGGKGPGLQVNLYVTSVLLVVSDQPLAVDGIGGSIFDGGGAAAADVTASRLAGAAAALERVGGFGYIQDPVTVSTSPAWRIVHQVDLWHNVPLVWWRVRRVLCMGLDAVLSPLLGI